MRFCAPSAKKKKKEPSQSEESITLRRMQSAFQFGTWNRFRSLDSTEAKVNLNTTAYKDMLSICVVPSLCRRFEKDPPVGRDGHVSTYFLPCGVSRTVVTSY